MQVFGPKIVQVFRQHGQQFQPTGEQGFVRRVVGTDTTDIFVHDLLQTLKSMNWQQIAWRNGSRDDLGPAKLVGLQWLEDYFLEIFILCLANLWRLTTHIVHVIDRRLASDPAFRERSRRELVRGATNGVAAAEKSVDGHHPVVSPLVFRGSVVRRTTRPCARASGMGAHDVWFGRGQFGIGMFGIDVLRGPYYRLPDRHAEKVLPANLLLMGILEGLLGDHADGATAGLDLFQKGVVPQAGWHRVAINVIPDQFFSVFVPCGLVVIPIGILGIGLEMQEVGADRAIAVLEPGEDDAVFHLRHLSTGEDGQCIGGGAAPWRIPGPSHAFAGCARLEDVRCATSGHDNGLRAEDVEIPSADIETDGACDPIGVRLIPKQVCHHDPVVDFGGCLARGLGDNRLVAFAVNHDLPLAFAQIPPGFRVFHDGQAPLLELVHRRVDVAGNVVPQILPHQPHEIVPGVADMVLGLILVPLHAHVAIDCIQALSDSAASLNICLFDADNL